MKTKNFHICSLNCQGLARKEKRFRLFSWFQQQKCDILMAQETHLSKDLIKQINNEFHGKHLHSLGTTNSRGVSYFINKSLDFKLINEFCDKEGRIIIINIEIQDKIFTLVNLYAPNEVHARNQFYKKVSKLIEEHTLGALIVGGDMNDLLSALDTKNNKLHKKLKKPVNGLKQLIKTHKLIDIWRQLNKDKKQFTWKRKNSTNEASRIDFFIICTQARLSTVSADIRPAQISFTDHQAISLKLDIYANNRGKGYFKMNNSILTDTQYNKLINKLIEKYEQNFNLTNVLNQWDLLKTDIRESTIQYCKSKAKKGKIIF